MKQSKVVGPKIIEKVIKITCEKLDLKPEAVTDTASFVYDLGADSLDITELSLILEEEYKVDLCDEIGHSATVGEVCRLIEQKMPEAAQA